MKAIPKNTTTGRAASGQQRPQIATVWPNGNPAQVRSEREVAKVLAILDAIKKEGRAG